MQVKQNISPIKLPNKEDVLIYQTKDSFHYELEDLTEDTMISSISDTMFMAMFNNTNRIKCPANLLSAIYGLDKKKVYKNIKLIKNKMNLDNIHDSKKTVDFVCEIGKKIYNIEMNNFDSSKGSIERNLSYAFDLYKSSMKSGDDKYHYNYTIQTNLCNYSYKGNDNLIDVFFIQNEKYILTDKLIFVFIYLPKLKKLCYNKDIKDLNELEKYLSLLVETNIKKALEIAKGDKDMEEFVNEAIDASSDNEIIGLYDKELHEKRLKNTLIEETREEGFNAGLEQGLEQGSLSEKKEIAKSMLKNGIDIDIIVKCTGLSKNEIENL